MGQDLYKRGYSKPLLKCLGPWEAQQALEEVHKGDYGAHLGGRALVRKILRPGFFWPTLRLDVAQKVRMCEKCQKRALLTIKPPSSNNPIF